MFIGGVVDRVGEARLSELLARPNALPTQQYVVEASQGQGQAQRALEERYRMYEDLAFARRQPVPAALGGTARHARRRRATCALTARPSDRRVRVAAHLHGSWHAPA